MILKINKKGYEIHANIPFKGEYTEYGKWQLKKDTLILKSEFRKDKYDKNNTYHTNYRKQKYEYEKEEKFLILNDQMCPLYSTNRGKGYCYIEK